MSVSFFVAGKPEPAGSKRVVPAGGRPGGRPLVVDDNRRAAGWKRTVAAVARYRLGSKEPLQGPVGVFFEFQVDRPKGHRGAKGLTKQGLEKPWPTSKPDLLKLARAVEDALTGIVYADDAQIVMEGLTKRWTDDSAHQEQGVFVTCYPMQAHHHTLHALQSV